MEKKSGKIKRVTPRWFIRHLFLPTLPWVALIWLVTVFVVANNSAVLKAVPMRENIVDLERKLKDQEKPGCKIADVQNTRAKLILEYIDKNQLVKAREQLLTYKNWLDTNPDLSLDQRIEMHKQLAIIHTTLGELETAVKEYSLILQDLDLHNDPKIQILKARFLNNRGVANFLLSQGTKDLELRKKYLTSSIDDFEASKQLTESKDASGKENSNFAYLDQIVKANESCLDLEMTFKPLQLQP